MKLVVMKLNSGEKNWVMSAKTLSKSALKSTQKIKSVLKNSLNIDSKIIIFNIKSSINKWN